jgi:TnpA family transposase
MLLRKLTNYSRKNRLYQAFHVLGCVMRTVSLLKPALRCEAARDRASHDQ